MSTQPSIPPGSVNEYQLPGLILSVQSNQFVQSNMQFVQSKMRNCAAEKHKVEDIIVQFSKSILITSLRSSLLNRPQWHVRSAAG